MKSLEKWKEKGFDHFSPETCKLFKTFRKTCRWKVWKSEKKQRVWITFHQKHVNLSWLFIELFYENSGKVKKEKGSDHFLPEMCKPFNTFHRTFLWKGWSRPYGLFSKKLPFLGSRSLESCDSLCYFFLIGWLRWWRNPQVNMHHPVVKNALILALGQISLAEYIWTKDEMGLPLCALLWRHFLTSNLFIPTPHSLPKPAPAPLIINRPPPFSAPYLFFR